MSTPAEGLATKKRVRAGHKASAKRMIGQVDSELAALSPELTRLSQLRRSLEEKLETLKLLDVEILDLVEDEEALADEIEQADEFKSATQPSSRLRRRVTPRRLALAMHQRAPLTPGLLDLLLQPRPTA